MNLNVVNSSPNLGDKFSFCLFSPGSSTAPIKIKSSMAYIRGNRCIERMVTLKSKIEVPRDIRNSKTRRHDKFWKEWSQY